MAVRVPFGYGNARFGFLIDEEWVYLDMPVSHVSFPKEIEVKQEFYNIYGNLKKKIKGYRYSFDATLVGSSIGTTQTELMQFLWYYRKLDNDDKSFYFYPHYSTSASDINYVSTSDFRYLVVLDDYTLSNIETNSVAYGQYLKLSMKTRDMISKSDYDNKEVLFRRVDGGTFGTYPLEGAGGAGIEIGSLTIGYVR